MKLAPINRQTAAAFVERHHYARTTPATVRFTLGWYEGHELVGVALWGVGVRPRHTIQKLFPPLGTDDYLELNRFCLLDEMPRNSETRFLGACVDEIRRTRPAVKLLLSWADGLRGKPGYIYQAANWLYGGLIKSDFYVAEDGEVVHPRLLITRYGSRSVWQELRMSHVWGYQFRYCICMSCLRDLFYTYIGEECPHCGARVTPECYVEGELPDANGHRLDFRASAHEPSSGGSAASPPPARHVTQRGGRGRRAANVAGSAR